MSDNFAYQQLLDLLEAHSICYRLIEHSPEGVTEKVSKLRGNQLEQAAKAIIILAKFGKKSRYYNIVIPGDCRVDFDAVKRITGADRLFFAPVEKATELTGCEPGTIPPFTFNPEMQLIVDPGLLRQAEIVFNACRLDQSIFMASQAYVTLAKPEIAAVALPPPEQQSGMPTS